jgi:hypothetical protein
MQQDGPIFRSLKPIVRLFVRKPVIINLSEDMPMRAIFISNHSAVSGPLVLSLFFPYAFIPWGTYEMTEGFTSRFNYLYHVLYRQKLKYSIVVAFTLSLFFASISKMLYKGAKLIPTYPDFRLMKTFRKSEEAILSGHKLLIFPEDSENGYMEMMERYHPGFIAFSSFFYKKHDLDIAVYPVYFEKRLNAIMIGHALHMQDMMKNGLTKTEIAAVCLTKTNQLRDELIKRYDPRKKNIHTGLKV